MTDPTASHEIVRFHDDPQPAVDFLTYLGRSFSTPSLYTRRYFDWKIGSNPFGKSGAYLRYRDGVAAAHCSIVAKPGNPAIVPGALGELGDTHTHPDFQRQGHFSAIGRHVIEDFEQLSPESEALIYGLPNENALPGWTRSIGCLVPEMLGIEELQIEGAAVRNAFFRRFRPRKRRASGAKLRRADPAEVPPAVDAVWQHADRSVWLIEKSSRWWSWRYRHATEPYRTYILRGVRGEPEAWLVARFIRTRIPWIRRVVIADLVAVSAEAEVEALEQFLGSVPWPFDRVSSWFQPKTEIGARALALGFCPVRKVPVIFGNNGAYANFQKTTPWFRLAIGDTDNI